MESPMIPSSVFGYGEDCAFISDYKDSCQSIIHQDLLRIFSLVSTIGTVAGIKRVFLCTKEFWFNWGNKLCLQIITLLEII